MKENNNREKIKKAIKLTRKTHKGIARTMESIASMIPRIKVAEFKLPDFGKIEFPDISKIESSDVIKERNAWERHSDLIGTLGTALKIQEETLKEQRSNTKLTKFILILALISVIISCVAILKSFAII